MTHAEATGAPTAPAPATDGEPPARVVLGPLAMRDPLALLDRETRDHAGRVANLALRLALAAGWAVDRAWRLHRAALFHDLGKLMVPPEVLTRPGPLTDAEWVVMRRHPAVGADLAAAHLDREARDWVRHHHERWDGAGYPDGLAGDEIPAGAQLLALADALDAITSDRPHSAARSAGDAIAECASLEGLQFSPRAVAALAVLLPLGTPSV